MNFRLISIFIFRSVITFFNEKVHLLFPYESKHGTDFIFHTLLILIRLPHSFYYFI